jgi:hypothetical protein
MVGGIYVGYAFTFGRSQLGRDRVGSDGGLVVSQLKFGPGDAFPLETCWDSSGAAGSMDSLLAGKQTIVIFASWECGPCLDLLRDLHQKLFKRVNPNAQVVLAIEKALGSVPDEYAGMIRGVRVAFIDQQVWRSVYHATSWPTIVGVDNSGIVKHVQFGYDGFIDHELVEEFFSTGN